MFRLMFRLMNRRESDHRTTWIQLYVLLALMGILIAYLIPESWLLR